MGWRNSRNPRATGRQGQGGAARLRSAQGDSELVIDQVGAIRRDVPCARPRAPLPSDLQQQEHQEGGAALAEQATRWWAIGSRPTTAAAALPRASSSGAGSPSGDAPSGHPRPRWSSSRQTCTTSAVACSEYCRIGKWQSGWHVSRWPCRRQLEAGSCAPWMFLSLRVVPET